MIGMITSVLLTAYTATSNISFDGMITFKHIRQHNGGKHIHQHEEGKGCEGDEPCAAWRHGMEHTDVR